MTRRMLAVGAFLAAVCADAVGAEPARPDGAAVFEAKCARCHGAAGKTDTSGARALKVRPLADDAAIAKMAPEEIVHAIKADPKHQGLNVLDGVDEAQLEAVAGFVKRLANER